MAMVMRTGPMKGASYEIKKGCFVPSLVCGITTRLLAKCDDKRVVLFKCLQICLGGFVTDHTLAQSDGFVETVSGLLVKLEEIISRSHC